MVFNIIPTGAMLKHWQANPVKPCSPLFLQVKNIKKPFTPPANISIISIKKPIPKVTTKLPPPSS